MLLLFLASLYRTQALAHAMVVSVGTTAVVPAEPATTSIAPSSAQQTAVASFVSGAAGLNSVTLSSAQLNPVLTLVSGFSVQNSGSSPISASDSKTIPLNSSLNATTSIDLDE